MAVATLLVAVAVPLAECKPAAVVRGDEVVCTVRVPEDHVVIARRAIASGRTHVERNAPAVFESFNIWRGRAIVSTRVEFIVARGSRTSVATSAFAFRPRTFPRLGIETDDVTCTVDSAQTILKDPPELAPAAREEPLPAEGALSRATLVVPPPSWELISEGPNAGWYFVSAPTKGRPSLRIMLTRAFDEGSALFRAQYSDMSLPVPSANFWQHCRKADLAVLRRKLLESEGCSGDLPTSRVRKIQEHLQTSLDLNRELERFVAPMPATMKTNPFTHELQRRLEDLARRALESEQARPPPLGLFCRLRRAN